MKNLAKSALILAAGLLTACHHAPQSQENPIRLNQVGYYCGQEKTAVVDGVAEKATLTNEAGETVWEGEAVRQAESAWSGKVRYILDFSEVTEAGQYTLHVGDYSQPVVISNHAFQEVGIAGMKAFYLQRCGMPIEQQYAGIYARPAGHMDTMVVVHPSAASASRPEGTVISSPYGWYDAGDYNKYIVNSGFSIGLMLATYELNPEYFRSVNLNIPESGSPASDFLEEIMYNLRWMQTMQDPEDGGVYHKLTTPSFEDFIQPTNCHQTRYVVQKSTQAALDFAATMAQAARIYGQFDAYRTFAQEATAQAVKAYQWAEANPDVMYDQPGNNEKYEPQVSTGMYDDKSAADEFYWAATELYLTTGDEKYLEKAKELAPKDFHLPTWGDVSHLATYEWLAQSLSNNNDVVAEMAAPGKQAILDYLNSKLASVGSSCFQSAFGNAAEDFGWGCMGEFCSGQAIAMVFGYYLTHDQAYLTGAIQNADHLLGRNATGYCFVTGFGTKQVMHPHHRLSASDSIEAPLPGFLAGGPNAGQQDKANVTEGYPSDYPDESYADNEASYASNEIAINWNAALVSMLWGIESALQ